MVILVLKSFQAFPLRIHLQLYSFLKLLKHFQNMFLSKICTGKILIYNFKQAHLLIFQFLTEQYTSLGFGSCNVS